ncbi:MAG: glycoside hydrolase TIM-barrel-like domain-containing protein, partial [Devosiaceae bacterium]
MATLVLGAVGSALGGTLGGGVGAILGKAAGSFLGNAIDHHLFGQTVTSHQEGNRLKNLDVQTSTEGAPMPLTFGKVRLAGQVIWATRFEEVATTTRHESGGKGGGGGGKQVQTSTSYSYFGNLAIGLCEGPIAMIGRVWADGKLIDQNTITMRVHRGTEDQTVDPLIDAKESASPAYRGTAYVVIERLPLEPFGNRLPQFSFEVLRPVGGLEDRIRAVTMIPGATEFGYHPEPVLRTSGYGVTQRENTHSSDAPSDWHASLDQLQALCPNVERVALVVSWFGTSLNAGECKIEPRVELKEKSTSKAWSVAGLDRASANAVSLFDGRPAYGSTPDDASLIATIKDLKARGLKVTLLPFIMMDVPQDNTLGDPWTGAASQPAYPWRGQITVSPSAGQANTANGTALAGTQLETFVGSVTPGTNEWSFRRFILHMASLADQAGGVDAFLLSSELRGLTKVRDDTGSYPFVDALVTLASDVRAILGSSTMLTYGADWSEYSNHSPDDGSGDLIFHLDPLWASPDIDAIGIDQYQPITDWRYTANHLDSALGSGPYDPEVIMAGLRGGENYHWYYASDADREAQLRTPITDSQYNEPWVHRSKDLVSWWASPHHNRIGGVRQVSPTDYVPGQKPLWLCEFGAPAVDLGGNRPSAFPSDKPDNDSLPHSSRGYRDDAQQRVLLDTALKVWGDIGTADNPLSPLTGQPMLDPSAIHLWTWDARPYPVFPNATNVWSDGVNWSRGHWLNGRLGVGSLADILLALCEHFDLPPMDVSAVH